MKKLLAFGCCILFLQSFPQFVCSKDAIDQTSGKRVLIKAIAVIVNTDANRKVPPRRIYIPNLESPRD